MKRKIVAGVLLVFFLITVSDVCRAEEAYALLRGTDGSSKISGTIILKDTDNGIEVKADVQNTPAGRHGFHIHFAGNCGNNGKLAGGHFNPDGSPHGDLLANGFQKAHAGDLGNLEVSEEGVGSYDALIAGLSISRGAYAIAGRAFILHEKPDDFGQPTGNAGARLACGTIIIGTLAVD